MKKLLAIILCVLMLVSCMALVSFAEDVENDETTAETTASVTMSDGKVIDGWTNGDDPKSGIANPEINTEIDPEGAVAVKLTGSMYGYGGYRHPNGNGTYPTAGLKIRYRPSTETFDLTGMNYLVFEVYVSDADILNPIQMFVDLGGSGRLTFLNTFQKLCGTSLVDGWNRIEIPLNTFNASESKLPFDYTQCNTLQQNCL